MTRTGQSSDWLQELRSSTLQAMRASELRPRSSVSAGAKPGAVSASTSAVASASRAASAGQTLPIIAAPVRGAAKPGAVLRDAEYRLTQDDFERVRSLIHAQVGISLTEAKVDMVYSRLVRRLRATGLASFTDYLNWLESPAGQAEWESFINALTTNLTSFFRESHHFDIFAQQLRSLQPGLAQRGPVQVWSCAASTGEEAYSLAMVAVEVFGRWDPPVQILATDVDTQVISAARIGVYSDDRVRSLSPERLQKFFLKGHGAQRGQVRVRPELQQLVSFRQLNLLAPSWNLKPTFDAIFCRNVMIYFDKPTQLKLLQRLVATMTPAGLFYAGHSESFHAAQHVIRLRERTVYERARGDWR